jgi:hypothetical protein
MKSIYGDRDTHGTTYVKAQKNSVEGFNLGDISPAMAQGLVDDLNIEIACNPFEGRPFYLNAVEERDLQMKNCWKRKMHRTLYRPYPEDNTLVFYVIPKSSRVQYCWDLPHHSEFLNILSNELQYPHEYISNIRSWATGNLTNFGFIKVSMTSSQVEGYKEKTIIIYKKHYVNYCTFLQMDPKSIEAEQKTGFFWIPNKFKIDKDCTTKNEPKISLVGL